MKRFLRILVPTVLLAVSCDGKDIGGEPRDYSPFILAELKDSSAFGASFTVRSFDSKSIFLAASSGTMSAEEVLATGLETPTDRLNNAETIVTINGLECETSYIASILGIGPSGELSEVVSVPFCTTVGSESRFSWGSERSGPPFFADVSLVTRGQHNSVAPLWSVDRFNSHITYTDSGDKEKWLFEAILCTEGFDSKRGYTLCISSRGQHSGTKESWQDLLDYWFAPDGTLSILEQAVAEAAGRIGEPPSPRYVIIGVPDPIIREYFTDKDSPTDYWGELDGRRLDFADVQDQIKAYLWYIDECRKAFDERKYPHLELAGFYVISEELPLAKSFFDKYGISASESETWNADSKRWEVILPATASYLHSCNEGLYWVPYYLAPGYRMWRKLGFDMAWMQPNHYWDTANQHPIENSLQAMIALNMGIELEFEFSLVRDVMKDGRWGPDGAGRPTFRYNDIPALEIRFKEYMDGYREANLYGVNSIAMYSGTDAMNQLARSTDPDDRKMYLELCHFIADSPLRKRN